MKCSVLGWPVEMNEMQSHEDICKLTKGKYTLTQIRLLARLLALEGKNLFKIVLAWESNIYHCSSLLLFWWKCLGPVLTMTHTVRRQPSGMQGPVSYLQPVSAGPTWQRLAYPPATTHMFGKRNSWMWPKAKMGQTNTDGEKPPTGSVSDDSYP